MSEKDLSLEKLCQNNEKLSHFLIPITTNWSFSFCDKKIANILLSLRTHFWNVTHFEMLGHYFEKVFRYFQKLTQNDLQDLFSKESRSFIIIGQHGAVRWKQNRSSFMLHTIWTYRIKFRMDKNIKWIKYKIKIVHHIGGKGLPLVGVEVSEPDLFISAWGHISCCLHNTSESLSGWAALWVTEAPGIKKEDFVD